MAYVLQLREIEREVTAIRAHATAAGLDPAVLPTLDRAKDAFDEWLCSSTSHTVAAVTGELAELSDVLGLSRR